MTSPQTHRRLTPPIAFALFCVLVAGAALRFHRIGTESVWLDEAYSIQVAQDSPRDIAEDTALDVHPPLYYVLLHYWTRLAGDTEAGVRALSALLGVCTILTLYCFVTDIFDRVTGLIAAALLSLAPAHLAVAQEARMYALLAWMSLLSMYFFARLLGRDADRPDGVASSRITRRDITNIVGYVLATSGAFYTHAYGGFIFGAELAFVAGLPVVSRPEYLRVWRRVLLAQGCAVLVFLPWLPTFLQQVFQVQLGFWIPPRSPASLWLTLELYAGSASLAWVLVPLAAMAALLARPRRWTVLLALWLACGVLVPFLISRVSSPIFLPKYTIAASIAFAVLAARGITLFPQWTVRAALVAVIVALSFEPLGAYYRTIKKDDWRATTAMVDTRAQPGDLVLFDQPFGQIAFDYYTRRTDLVEDPFLVYRDGLTTRSVVQLLELDVAPHARVWLILSSYDPLWPTMLGVLKARYRVESHISRQGIETYLLVR